jgi:hypothetical protein
MAKTASDDKKRLKPELAFSEYSAYGVDQALKADLKAKAKAFGLPSQDLILTEDDVTGKDSGEDKAERLGKKFGVGKQQAKS